MLAGEFKGWAHFVLARLLVCGCTAQLTLLESITY